MTTPPPEPVQAPPRWKPLDARQRRVLGVLIEKAKTTPAAYPMTVNAIVTGCNQKSNRDPLMTLDDFDVSKVLTELGALEVVSELDWVGRVPKYKHRAYEWLGVSKVEMAVMTELLLRGAQALGELRARAARMEPIADLAALKPIVDALVGRRLVIELTPPGRGQIVSHNLYLPAERAEVRAQVEGHPSAGGDHAGDAGPPVRPRAPMEIAAPGQTLDAIGRLFTELADLRAEVAGLREQVATLEARLDAAGGPDTP